MLHNLRSPLVLLLGMLAMLLLAPHARAQVASTEPFYAVVTTEGTLLRSNPTPAHYPVAKLKNGQMLRVDGENREWARVTYPAGVPALVPADAVQVDTATRTATLTAPTQLKAFNMNTGLPGSWKPLLEQPLEPGTKLALIDLEPADDTRGGRAFKVVPPEAARAYVQTSFIRRATPEEVSAYLAQTRGPGEEPAAEQPAEPEQPRPAPERPVPTEVVPTPAPAETPLTEPMAPPAAPGAQPLPPAGEAPEETVIDQSQRVPGEAEQADEPEEPAGPRPATVEELEEAYAQITTQPVEQAELTELMAEYERSLASLDDSPYNRRLRARLQQRLDLLKIRADLQAQMRRLAEQRQVLSEDERRLAARLQEVDRTRQYTIVGRLSASTLYDGERLPLMYRIQSVGGTPRTLGYIRPEPGMKLDAKLGQVVGVVGEAAIDPALRLNVVNARRVDILQATDPAGEPAPAASPAQGN